MRRPATQAILAALEGASGRTRVVGGVVRDTLFGRERTNPDIDMATELLPVVVMQRAKAAGIAAHPTGIDHGTVTLVLDNTIAEVTTLREDVATDGRHAEVRFGTDWVRDAERRDFTINALYCEADGTLFDPLGGLPDLEAGRVRFIGDAAKRIAEDGLRVWRFFRFSASHAQQRFDPEGLAACRHAVGHLDHISAERIGSEMRRMLALPQIARTLAVMAEIGLLDAGEQVLGRLFAYEALGGASSETRLAMLSNGDVGRLVAAWRLSNAEREAMDSRLAAADLLSAGKLAWAAYRFGEAAVEGLALAAARGGWRREQLAEIARELGRLPVAPLPVKGQDLIELGMQQGPALGATLKRLETAWVDSAFTLERKDLLLLASSGP
nr:CCA tRNA nucleotidyltransferase [Devosia oryzisoli]